MGPDSITALQEKFRIAFFDGNQDGATRIATDAVAAGFAADKVTTEMALARFYVEESLDQLRHSPPPPGAETPEAEALTLTPASEVTEQSVEWLWPGWLPRGELTLLAGQPGAGKTTLALAVASILSLGGEWPNGEQAKPAQTIFWTAEDSIEKTIVPRLRAHGADMEKVKIINYGKRIAFDPAQHMGLLRDRLAEEEDVRLLILDPVISVLQGVVRDSHRATDVRQGLVELQSLIAERDVTTIGITHFAKGTKGTSPLERMIGSQVWGAAARVVWVAACDSDSGVRTLVQCKNNLSAEGGAFAYTIEVPQGHEVTRATFGEHSDMTAAQVLQVSEAHTRDPEELSAIEQAQEFLTDILDGMGWVSAKKIDREVRANHVSMRTFQRARAMLKEKGGVQCRRSHDEFQWRIPNQEVHPGIKAVN